MFSRHRSFARLFRSLFSEQAGLDFFMNYSYGHSVQNSSGSHPLRLFSQVSNNMGSFNSTSSNSILRWSEAESLGAWTFNDRF
jgi:hypothetical protein